MQCIRSAQVPKYSKPLSTQASICSAFASELYLKLLIGKRTRGHNLARLFEMLAPEVQDEVVAAYKLPDFRERLLDVADTFEEWRYVHEKSMAFLMVSTLEDLTKILRAVAVRRNPDLVFEL
jgi:hypothetical protein